MDLKRLTTPEVIELTDRLTAPNYFPLPIVASESHESTLITPSGKKILDFLSSYSALSQGHTHPKILEALITQAKKCTLTSRAIYNDVFPQFASLLCQMTGFECILPSNTGTEAVESAFKLCRKWGYEVKGIENDKAIIIAFNNNFHGRTMGSISLSTDLDSTQNFGPLLSNIEKFEYGKLTNLENYFKKNHQNICGLIIEPIQGEAGIIVPPNGYLTKISKLCKKYNVLMVCDEIQTGLGRCGVFLAYQDDFDENNDTCKPDVICLGKALGGGILPVSCILSSREILNVLTPGTHGSTFGGNPLASAVAMASLQVIKEENLIENAKKLGNWLKEQLLILQKNSNGIISEVRGKGLLLAIVIDPNFSNGRTAWDYCLLLKKYGILAKPTHKDIIRLAPPLIITNEELSFAIDILRKCLDELPTTEISNH